MDRQTCSSCGARIQADVPQGLCPACLLRLGLEELEPTRELRLVCAACRAPLPEDARFCASCGAPAPAPPEAAKDDPVLTALRMKLQGQYRVLRLLGRGGMGAVYLARDLTLDREVAIKVIRTPSNGREAYDRFRGEAKTAARLSHPNIVPLHAFGDVEGMPYFVMGYVRGESLAALLRREGRMPEGEARRVLQEVADALDHAHRLGVIHRDIKPDNVLLEDASGRALLTDFGVAKALGVGETPGAHGTIVGTPSFMSPEQAAGRAVDGRSDIYSLGVMAYEMLAGRLPFEGSAASEVLAKHLTQEPPPLRSLEPGLSDTLVQSVERCLAKDAGLRWPDARSLRLSLGASDESQLPDALQPVDGRGAIGLTAAVALVVFYIALAAPDGGPGAEMPIVSGVALVALYGIMVRRLMSGGFSHAQVERAVWREPAWWLWWYPRTLRRSGNVWDRLPAAVRRARGSILALCLLFPLFAVQLALGIDGMFRRWRPIVITEVFLMLGMAATWGWLRRRARRELERKGITRDDLHRVMLSAPPSRAGFWARPHIAAVLAPAPCKEARPRSGTPHEQLQSILRHADELQGPMRRLGADASIAARQLIESIEQADREIGELAKSLEPGEERRLSERIDALASAPGSNDELAPMRALLGKQLELYRQLSGRIEEARVRRSGRVEVLKTLALHVASLSARTSHPLAELRSLTERVRALCDDIESQTTLGAPRATGETARQSSPSRAPDPGRST